MVLLWSTSLKIKPITTFVQSRPNHRTHNPSVIRYLRNPSNVEIHWRWQIIKSDNGKVAFSEEGTEKQLTLFPNMHLSHARAFNGTYLNDYILNSAYEITFEYRIVYSNNEINKSWTSNLNFKYNIINGESITGSNSN